MSIRVHVWIIYICVLGTTYFLRHGQKEEYIVSDKLLPVLTPILLASEKKLF